MRTNQNQSGPLQPRFTVGRDNEGRWIVRDRLDRVGGLFASEHAARHFAFEEADHDTTQIGSTSGLVEFFVGSSGEASVH